MANITSGSPRLLNEESLSSLAQDDRIGKAQIGFEVRTIQDFDALHALVPQNCLIGENDVIPGLELETFPKP